MKNLSLVFVFLSFITLTGCFEQNGQEIADLRSRLEKAEAKLNAQNGKSSETINFIESGQCTITEIEEDSALLSCVDGTSFRIRNGQDGTSCTVSPTGSGSEISCSDGTNVEVTNGENGIDGQDGANGQDGSICTVQQVEDGAEVSCTDGTTALISNGLDGSSCTVIDNTNGARIRCLDGSEVVINNGTDGQDGQNGINGQDGQSAAPCTIERVENGARIICGDDEVIVYDGSEENQNEEISCNGTRLVKTIQISFNDPGSTCSFGQNENLERRQAYVQAKATQIENIDLPANAKVCDMKFNFSDQDFHYDDSFVLSWNSVALITNDENLLSVNNDGIKEFDFLSIRGQSMNFYNQTPYCLGEENGSNCEAPLHDIPGLMSLDLDQETIAQLGDQFQEKAQQTFELNILGDNDNNDCRHSGLSFSVEVEYVK